MSSPKKTPALSDAVAQIENCLSLARDRGAQPVAISGSLEYWELILSALRSGADSSWHLSYAQDQLRELLRSPRICQCDLSGEFHDLAEGSCEICEKAEELGKSVGGRARGHAVDLEQCSLLAGDPEGGGRAARSMIEAARFLRSLAGTGYEEGGGAVNSSSLAEWRKRAECAEAALAEIAARRSTTGPRYQYREIGEGEGWRDCSHMTYLAFARDPHIDTREVPAEPSIRTCTCSPSDDPPQPCPERYALSECRAAAGAAASDTLSGVPDGVRAQVLALCTVAKEGHRCVELAEKVKEHFRTHPVGQSIGQGAEDTGRDFQMMLARIASRYTKGLDISATVTAARDLLKRKGTLSPFRTSPTPDSNRTGDEGAEEKVRRIVHRLIERHFERTSANSDAATEAAIRDLAALAARPAAPEAQGAWSFDLETAPQEHGRELLGWGRLRGSAPIRAIMTWFDAGGDFNGRTGWWSVATLPFEPIAYQVLPAPPAPGQGDNHPGSMS